MGVAERISRDLALVRSEEFAAMCRARPQDFTRRRKLTADVLAESLLARKGRTLSIELRDMRRDAGVDVTKQGYLKAREKMRPEALLELARHHARGVYADGDAVLFHGMVVVGVDGSSGDVPTNEVTIERYGNASPSGRDQATIGISAAFDPLTGQLLDLSLHRGSFDERAQVMGHLVTASRVTGGMPLLVIGDRGYPSLLLMAQVECAGGRYLFRCSKGFLCAEFRAAAEAGGDLWRDVRLTRRRLQDQAKTNPGAVDALVELGTLRARFCVVDVGGEEPEGHVPLVAHVAGGVARHDREVVVGELERRAAEKGRLRGERLELREARARGGEALRVRGRLRHCGQRSGGLLAKADSGKGRGYEDGGEAFFFHVRVPCQAVAHIIKRNDI